MRNACLVLLLCSWPLLAMAQLRTDFSGDLPLAVRWDHARMQAMMDRAEWAKALPLAERMLAAALADKGAMQPIAIDLALRHIDLLDALDRDNQALAEVTALFGEVRRNFTEWSVFYASVEVAYARQLANAGRGGEALPVALGLARRVGGMFGSDSVVAAGFLRDTATILRRLGHVEEAVEAYRRIVPLLDSDPTFARQAAATVFLIADSLDMLGQGEASLVAFREADARQVRAYGPRHSETLAVRLAHGRLALVLEKTDEAVAILDADLPVVAGVFGPDNVQYGTWLRLQARRLQVTKGPTEAIAAMDRAVTIIAARLLETHRVLAEARADYAGLLTFDKRYEDAWAQYVASEGALGPDRKFMLDLLQYRREAGTLTDASFPVTALPFVQRAASGAARGAVREQVLRRLIRDPAVAEIYRSATDLAEERRAAEPAFAELSGEVDLDVAALQALLDRDGFLTATDVAELRLNADWVVMSACNTAAGDEPGAEALSGLAQSFLYAGARALLVSHWPVESKSAVTLMTDLFAERAANPLLRAAEAHRLAMVHMIEHPADPRWSHPAYCAPFVLVGSPD